MNWMNRIRDREFFVMARNTRTTRNAFSLAEMLIVVVIISIAAAILAPSLSSADPLRVQGAVRTIVSDIAVAQSDAIAMQKKRGIRFTGTTQESSYSMSSVTGDEFDIGNPNAITVRLDGARFGHSRFGTNTFASSTLVFDELGSPINIADGAAAGTQYIDVVGPRQTYRITVEAFTGRCTVELVQDLDGP